MTNKLDQRMDETVIGQQPVGVWLPDALAIKDAGAESSVSSDSNLDASGAFNNPLDNIVKGMTDPNKQDILMANEFESISEQEAIELFNQFFFE